MADEDRTIPKEEVPQPPQPPEVRRATTLYWYQWVGIPAILLVVALAILGVFGESFDETAADGATLSMRVEYPSRFRYKQIDPVRVWVTNRTAQPIDTATVSFDRGYVLGFSNLSFIPSATRPFEVEVTDVKPGETRLVLVDLQAERYGRHAGEISATTGGADTVRARVSTLVYP